MDTKEYINLLYPNGRAYSNVADSKKFNNVLALQMNRVLEWIQDFQDQLWYINENFNPEIWEKRYNIDVPVGATLEERRITVRSYMIFPQTNNRLSLDYIQNQLNIAGFSDILIERNPTGTTELKLHGNNITGLEDYDIGSNKYNSIRISGNIKTNYYEKMLLLLMSIKPLDTVVFDNVSYTAALAYDDNFGLALNDNLIYAISQI